MDALDRCVWKLADYERMYQLSMMAIWMTDPTVVLRGELDDQTGFRMYKLSPQTGGHKSYQDARQHITGFNLQQKADKAIVDIRKRLEEKMGYETLPTRQEFIESMNGLKDDEHLWEFASLLAETDGIWED